MKKRILILAGPTAVGKTKTSILLAKELGGEIISADSMQIYKDMDIGSAKVMPEETEGIPHYMIDEVDATEEFSVSEFQNRAEEYIDNICSRGKLPIIAGGTGLYINSLIFNYNFADTNRDEEYRKYLCNLAEIKGNEYVHEMLKEIDPYSYEKLYSNDLKRVIRALEVYKVTGKTLKELNEEIDVYDIPYDIKYYVLNMDRAKLYERIDKRVDIMFENGLIEEVKVFKDRGLTSDMQSMKGIGYKEILMYLNDEISLEEAIYQIKKGSRNYAKRQLTWFRKDPRVKWINKDEFDSDEEIAKYIIQDFLK